MTISLAKTHKIEEQSQSPVNTDKKPKEKSFFRKLYEAMQEAQLMRAKMMIEHRMDY